MPNTSDDELSELTVAEIREMSDRKVAEQVKKAFVILINELNNMGGEEVVAKAFIDELRYTHRTLQQNLFGHVIIGVIKDFAKRYDEGYYDERNEASCSIAKKIEPVIKDAYFPFI